MSEVKVYTSEEIYWQVEKCQDGHQEFIAKPDFDKLAEALKLVRKFGYGVNIEKNMVIRNTADIVQSVLAEMGIEG